MARHTTRVKCAEEGCREVTFYEYGTRREEAEGRRWRQRRPWRCVEHACPELMLTRENLVRTTEVEVVEIFCCKEGDGRRCYCRGQRRSIGKFFGRSGFEHGLGYRALAAHWPLGTRLRVTAEILLPDPSPPNAENTT